MSTPRVQAGSAAVLAFSIVLVGAVSIPVPEMGKPYKYTQSVVEGDNLLTTCHVTMEPGMEVYWTRNDSNSTFRQSGTRLELIDIKRASSGDYVCHEFNASYHGDVDIKTVDVVTVDVQYPAVVPEMSLDPSIVMENKEWQCGALIDANPVAEFKIYNARTGKVLMGPDHMRRSGRWNVGMGSLPSQCTDAGEIRIAARNTLNHGVWAFQARHLTVLCRPIPDPGRNITHTKTAFLGQNASFHMDYVGYPAPDVQWEHNGRTLPPAMQHNVHKSTTIFITDVTMKDYELYTVTLTNTFGSSTTNFVLRPNGRPIPDPGRNITHTKTAFLGQNASFHMDYVGYPAPDVQWEHNGRTLPPAMQHNVHNSTTLCITDVTMKDYELYTVTLTNTIGSSTTNFVLRPNGRPIPDPGRNITHTKTAFLGQNASFHMDYVGYPAPDVQWEHNGRTLPPAMQHNVHNSTTLFITDVTMKDYELYTVTLTNTIGSSTTNFVLRPNGSPIPDPTRHVTYKETAFLEQNASFHMDYVGYPAPDVQWEHNGRTLPPAMQHNVHNSTTLFITDAVVNDYGLYTVTLTNAIGSSTTNFVLRPDGAPVRPYKLSYYNVTHTSVTLQWSSGFDMGTQQHFVVWKEVGRQSYDMASPLIYDTSSNHGINQTWNYTVTGLTSGTEYNFTVDSKNNRYSSGMVLPPILVTTLKNKPLKHRETVVEGDNLKIHCNITFAFDIEVYWTKNDSESGFRQNGTMLGLFDIKRAASEDYICHVISPSYHGNIEREVEVVTVDVLCKPMPDPGPNMTYTETELLWGNASFHMDFVACPTLDIHWEHAGYILPASMQHNDHNSTTLFITGVAVKDFGVYTMTLANEMGSSRTEFYLRPDGSPVRPYNVQCYNVTHNSVTLRWTSGFDMGTQQHFVVWRKMGGNYYMAASPFIYDTSPNHGINQNWSYTVTGLISDTEYNFTVDAEDANNHYTSGFVVPPLHIRTLPAAMPHDHSGANVAEIAGPAAGGLCLLVLLAVVVYKLHWRSSTSYGSFKKQQL